MWVGVYAIAALRTGRMADRVGHALIARVGCVICLVWRTGLCLYHGSPRRCSRLSSRLWTRPRQFLASLVIAWVGQRCERLCRELNTRLSNFSIAFSVGFVIGFWLIGLLYTYSPRLGFFVPAGLYCVVIALLTAANRIKVAPPVAEPIAALPL